MPLLPGKSEIGHNIREMEKAGHPHAQAVAASLRKAYDDPKQELRQAIAAGEEEARAEAESEAAGAREKRHQERALKEMDAAIDAAHAAGFMLRSPRGRVLFLKRSSKGDHADEWCCPGGSIEGGETPEQAAHRELQEETQYSGRVSGASPIDEREGFMTFGGKVDDEFTPRLNEEHTAYKWAKPTDPPQPLHPGLAATLAALHEPTLGDAADRREWDSNGWFEVKDNPLSKAGVFPYSEASVVRGGDRSKMVGVLRPPEELSSEEALKSFRLLPWTDDHPTALLGARENGLIPAEHKGVHGVIGEDVYFKDGTLFGNVKVWSEALARSISSGKRELSCGYQCDFVPEEGVYNGQPYQYVQRNIRGNHVASVDKGRMGSDVRVLDAAERFTFSLDLKEPAVREDDASMDEIIKGLAGDPIIKTIGDSFNSLVSKLEGKGYSKEYATKVAGKVAAEKGMTGHHDSTDGATSMAKETADSDKGDVKDPEGSAESGGEKEDLKPTGKKGGSTDRKAKDKRARDEESSEEEEGKDAGEMCGDSEKEEKEGEDAEEEKDERKDAKDRARGMDAAEVAALVDQKVASVIPSMRREAAAKLKLYGRLSPLIGAFDHDEMALPEMAAYGLKKLGAPEAKDPVTALDFYLAGRGSTPVAAVRQAQDRASEDSFVGKYLKSA